MTTRESEKRLEDYHAHLTRLDQEREVLVRPDAGSVLWLTEERRSERLALVEREQGEVRRKLAVLEQPELQARGVRELGPGKHRAHAEDLELKADSFRKARAERFESTSAARYYRVTGAGGSETGDWGMTEQSYASCVSESGTLDESKWRAWAAVPETFQQGPLEVHVMETREGQRVHGWRGEAKHQSESHAPATPTEATPTARLDRYERNDRVALIGSNEQLHVRAEYQRVTTYHVGSSEERALGKEVQARQPHAGKRYSGPADEERRQERLRAKRDSVVGEDKDQVIAIEDLRKRARKP